MTTITIDNCQDTITVEGCESETVVIQCQDETSPTANGRYEQEFFALSTLFVTASSHQLSNIKDAYVLDINRQKLLCNITIVHSTLTVTVNFTQPESGFLVII